MESPARSRFAIAASLPDREIDLAAAALLIAAEEQDRERERPALATDVDATVRRYLDRIDDLADAAAGHVRRAGAKRRALALIDFLARERGFRGNQDDYYDRRNSYLNDVIDRRLGIPITLAVIYIEVGRRIGLDIRGVGFPGHFLALHRGEDGSTIIDPFFGVALDEAACVERLRAIAGPEASFDPRMLSVVGTAQILTRMLANLKMIHLRSNDAAAALACSERILLLNPDLPDELRDRAALYLRLECWEAARRDLDRFLEIAPDHESAELVRGELVNLRAAGPSLH